MHVGYGAVFQNPNNALPDAEVYRNELRLAEMAEIFLATGNGNRASL